METADTQTSKWTLSGQNWTILILERKKNRQNLQTVLIKIKQPLKPTLFALYLLNSKLDSFRNFANVDFVVGTPPANQLTKTLPVV